MTYKGIILIDGAGVIIQIYETDTAGKHKLLHHQTRDLAQFTQATPLKPADVIEIIAESFFTSLSMNVKEWKICARNVSEDFIRDITSATKFPIENLLLIREQELLCKGILMEF